jgi:outer membrane lipoprotein SlyB
MNRTVVAFLLAAALAGCATANTGSPDTSVENAAGGACRIDSLGRFVGQAATPDLGAAVLRASGAKALQWVAAGMMVTMDFREDRVRIYLDEQNKVQRVSCG